MKQNYKLYKYEIVIWWLMKHNMNEKEFSEKYNMPFPIVSMMMDNDESLTVNHLLKLADIIKVDFKDLFYDI